MIKNLKKFDSFFLPLFLALICGLFFCFSTYFNSLNSTKTDVTRTIEISQTQINYQSVLEGFENSKLETQGSLTTFEGTKTLDWSDLEALDNVGESDVDSNVEIKVQYYFSYDNQTNIVTLSARSENVNGTIEVEEIQGFAFVNENNEIDALLEVDGEYILLSEMQDSGLIQNCGWFSNLFKKIVVAVVAVVVVSAVVACVVATCGAGLGAVIAAGAIAGAVTGGVAGGVISYTETGSIDWRWVVGGAVAGAIIGAATGWAVGTAMGVSSASSTIPKIGDTFGKYGTLTKNPAIKINWSNTTTHGAERLIERNMSKELAEKIVSTGKVFSQNAGEKFLYLTKEGAVVLGKDGQLITAYTAQEFDEAILGLIKLLGI